MTSEEMNRPNNKMYENCDNSTKTVEPPKTAIKKEFIFKLWINHCVYTHVYRKIVKNVAVLFFRHKRVQDKKVSSTLQVSEQTGNLQMRMS